MRLPFKAINPSSASEIEPRVYFWPEDEMVTGQYGSTYFVASAEGRQRFGSASYFLEQGQFLFDKKLRSGDRVVQHDELSHVFYNPAISSAFDRTIVAVHLPLDRGDNYHGRLVDASSVEFQGLDDKSFCVKAIAVAAFDFLQGAPKRKDLEERVTTGEEKNRANLQFLRDTLRNSL